MACGKNFTLALSQDGLVYGFGDNSSSQLNMDDAKKRAMSEMRPKLNTSLVRQHRDNIYQIQAGDNFIGISTDYAEKFKNFYMYGGKNIIWLVSQQSNFLGWETWHGLLAYGRGGSQNADGIALLDTLTEQSQPYMMKMAYKNIAILQQRIIED